MSTLHEDHSIDFIIDENYGIGLTFTDGRDNEAVSVLGEKLPRKARLRITSYRNLGFGIHWYGRISIASRRFRYTKITAKDDPFARPGDLLSIGGAYDQWKPEEMLCLTIELTRSLTAQEIDADQEIGANRFSQQVGDPTYGFQTRGAVLAAAIAVFQRVFCGRWVLVYQTTGDFIFAKEEAGDERKENGGQNRRS